MGLVRNNWKSRQDFRDNLEDNPFLRAGVTPVLLTFWTNESVDTFLIPATQQECQLLRKVHGIDMYGEGWETVGVELNHVINKVSHTYEDGDGGQVPQGEWRERYLVDTHDDLGAPLTPVTVPPGTVVVVTGFIVS